MKAVRRPVLDKSRSVAQIVLRVFVELVVHENSFFSFESVSGPPSHELVPLSVAL